MITETPPGGTPVANAPSAWEVPSKLTDHGGVDRGNTKKSWSILQVGAIGSGPRYGRYTIIDTLQRGGMGEVVLAEIEHEGRKSRVVLKRLLADLLEDEKYVAMFLLEAQVMSHLNHPNIVKVFDVPVIDGKQCLAMEYVAGVNIHQVLKRCRALSTRMPPAVALYVACELLKGLQYAHGFVLEDGRPLELVHRDVTPGNVLASFEGDVKITDFGIAKSSMSNLSTTVGVVKGTTRYLSPEQIRGEPATFRSDLFSSASVLVEMFTGVPLFDRGSVPPTLFAIASGERPEIAKILPFHAPRLAAVLERALSVRPELRPVSALALHDALIEASDELGRPLDRAGLSSFLKELFPERQESMVALVDGDGHMAALDKMDLTYLFEVHDSVVVSGDHGDHPTLSQLPEVLQSWESIRSMVTGSQPLDAEAFDDGRWDRSDRGRPRNVVEIHVHGNEESSAAALAAVGGGFGSSPVPVLSTPPLPLALPGSTRSTEPASGASDPRSRAVVDRTATPLPEPRPRGTSDPGLVALAGPRSRSLPDPSEGMRFPPPPPPASTAPVLPLISPEADLADVLSPAGLPLSPGETSDIRAVRSPVRKPVNRVLLFTLGVIAGVVAMRFLDVAERDRLVLKSEAPSNVAVVRSAGEAATHTVGAPIAPLAVVEPEKTIEPMSAGDVPSVVDVKASTRDESERAEREPARPAESPKEGGVLDIRRPKNARVIVDGALLTKKTPILGWRLSRGPHKLVLIRGNTRKSYSFEVSDGERVDLSRLEGKKGDLAGER